MGVYSASTVNDFLWKSDFHVKISRFLDIWEGACRQFLGSEKSFLGLYQRITGVV